MSLNYYCEKEEERNKEISVNKYKYLFTDYEKNIPSLSEALTQIYNSLNLDDIKCKELVNEVIKKCKERIDSEYKEITLKYPNITKEDAYIICFYTFQSNLQIFSHINY